jgi:hypothetical protein
MNNLLALSAPQSIHAFQQNSLWMRLGYASVFVPSAKPGSRHPRLLMRHNYSARTFRKVQSCFSKPSLRQYTPSLPPLLLFPPTSPRVLFPCVEQRQG